MGTEPLVEGPVIGFAKTGDYRPEPIGLGLTVFLPDARSADVAKAPATTSDETTKILLQRNQLKRSARPSASKPTND